MYHHGGHARTPRDRVYVILNASLRNAALVHYHDRLRASGEAQLGESAASLCRSNVPARPRSKIWVGREGQRAARLVQRALLRTAAIARAALRYSSENGVQPGPGRVETCSPCRRCTGRPGCRDGPMFVDGRPRVLDICLHDPRLHHRL